MGDCLLTKCVVAYVSLSFSSLLAQEAPKSDDHRGDVMQLGNFVDLHSSDRMFAGEWRNLN